jgi:hypothetical protein
VEEDFATQLEAALQTRPVIEQAKGVLAGLLGLDADQAFVELRDASQEHNVKLHVLAATLVAAACSQDLPEPAAREAVVARWGGLLPGPSMVGDVDSEAAG